MLSPGVGVLAAAVRDAGRTQYLNRELNTGCQTEEFAFFFLNDQATPEIYTLSLHDALPISSGAPMTELIDTSPAIDVDPAEYRRLLGDRKSTRLNSSHRCISYAVFCLK